MRQKILGVLTLFTCYSLAFGQYSPSIQSDNHLDGFLLRVANRYEINLPRSFYAKPMKTSEVIQFFEDAKKTEKLSGTELYLLEKMSERLTAEKRLFGYTGKKIETSNYLNLDLTADLDLFKQSNFEAHGKGVFEFLFTGHLKNVSYFASVDVWTEYMSDSTFKDGSYEPYKGINYNVYGRGTESSFRSSDIVKGGISYDGKYIDLEAAVDQLKIGPSIYSPLTFNAAYAPVLYGKYRLDLELINYSHYFGNLKTQTDKKKYFYLHRLGFSLLKDRFKLGINEVIINGSTAELAQTDPLRPEYFDEERTLEWAYMLPFVPFAFLEHYLGDRDNANLSFDVDVSLLKNARFYLEFFLDDISDPIHIFNEDWGNKWALTAGAQYFGSILDKDVTVSFEYSRVEPWVYTHFYGGSHRYTHYGQTLGAPLGPNSDQIVLASDIQISNKNRIGLFFKNQRYNRNYRGGDINDVHVGDGNDGAVYDKDLDTLIYSVGSDVDTKEFLVNGYKHIAEGGVTWSFAPYEFFHVDSEFYFNSNERFGLKILGGFSFYKKPRIRE